MNTTNIYHGTNAADIQAVMDRPRPRGSINGDGFYCTNDLEVAKKYGRRVVCYVIDIDIMNKMNTVTRPIDQRYVDGLATYEECIKGGVEIVFNAKDANELALECEEAFIH